MLFNCQRQDVITKIYREARVTIRMSCLLGSVVTASRSFNEARQVNTPLRETESKLLPRKQMATLVENYDPLSSTVHRLRTHPLNVEARGSILQCHHKYHLQYWPDPFQKKPVIIYLTKIALQKKITQIFQECLAVCSDLISAQRSQNPIRIFWLVRVLSMPVINGVLNQVISQWIHSYGGPSL